MREFPRSKYSEDRAPRQDVLRGRHARLTIKRPSSAADHNGVDHRLEAFKIEQELRSDARVLRQIAGALKDVTEYLPAVRYATPILVPRDDGILGLHFRTAGKVMPREYGRSRCRRSRASATSSHGHHDEHDEQTRGDSARADVVG